MRVQIGGTTRTGGRQREGPIDRQRDRQAKKESGRQKATGGEWRWWCIIIIIIIIIIYLFIYLFLLVFTD